MHRRTIFEMLDMQQGKDYTRRWGQNPHEMQRHHPAGTQIPVLELHGGGTMLEEEHREICDIDDHNDPHGERRFKRSCIDYYNEIMAERSQVPKVPQHERAP